MPFVRPLAALAVAMSVAAAQELVAMPLAEALNGDSSCSAEGGECMQLLQKKVQAHGAARPSPAELVALLLSAKRSGHDHGVVEDGAPFADMAKQWTDAWLHPAAAASHDGKPLQSIINGLANSIPGLKGLKNLKIPTLDNFNCTEKPDWCGEPLHCDQPVSQMEEMSWAFDLTPGGQPNLKLWCFLPENMTKGIVTECIKNGDLAAASKIDWEVQNSVAKGNATALYFEASYCFLAGHCDGDYDATKSSTLAEMEQMCDAKYGHRGWTALGMTNADMWDLLKNLKNKHTIKGEEPKIANLYGKLACAMGNFHCDRFYCREHFCEDPTYKAQYGQAGR